MTTQNIISAVCLWFHSGQFASFFIRPSLGNGKTLANLLADATSFVPFSFLCLPIWCIIMHCRLSDEFKQDYPHVQQVWIQTMLRAKGWIVPNYGAPPAEEKTEMLRVVGAYCAIIASDIYSMRQRLTNHGSVCT